MSPIQSDLPPYGTFQSYQKSFEPHTYVGDHNIDLGILLQSLSAEPGGCPLYLHLFCDTLSVPQSPSKSFDLTFPPGLRSIEVFARNVFPSSLQQDLSDLSPLNFKSTKGSVTVMLYSAVFPYLMEISGPAKGLRVFTNTSHSKLPTTYPELGADSFFLTSDSVGISLRFDEKGLIPQSATLIAEVHPGLLEISMENLIQVDDYQRPNYLGHLLETVFAEAATQVGNASTKAVARSQFAFVASCCRVASSYSELYLQARKMQSRLQLPSEAMLWAPAVNFHTLEATLQYRVKLATLLDTNEKTDEIHDHIQSVEEQLEQVRKEILHNQADLKAKIGDVGAIIVTNIAFSNENFMAKVDDARQALTDAKHAMLALNDDFSQMQSALDQARDKFDKGVKQWKEEEEKKAMIEGAVAVFEAACAIGSAFASEGATAGQAGAATAKAAKAVEGAAEAGEKIQITWKKIKDAFDKIKNVIEKVKKVISTVDAYKKAGKSSGKAMQDLTDALPGVGGGVDFTSMKLGWQEFQLDMTAVFADLQDDFSKVDGYTEWKSCTDKLVLRAYALISAEKDFQDASLTYEHAVRDAERVKAHQEELARISNDLQTQAAKDKNEKIPETDFSAAKRLLKLRDLITSAGQRSVHRWLFLDFHEYSSAIMYANALDSFPVPLSVTKALEDFLNDVTKVVLTIKDKHTVLTPLKFPIVFRANDDIAIAKGWQSTLQSTMALPFTLPTEYTGYENHKQLRLVSAEVYIEGLTPVKHPSPPNHAKEDLPAILISITIGPRTTVYNNSKVHQPFYIDAQTRTFDRRTAPDGTELPDSGAQPKGINQAAIFASDGVTFEPTLWSQGTIRIVNPEEWVWDKVTDVRLEFYCNADQL